MTDLAQLGLSIDAKPILTGLETVDKALAKTATAADALAAKVKTATGQMAAAFSKVKDGGAEKQAASLEKMNFAIEHQAKAYRALLAVMREDAAIAKSSAAQRILLNSAFASATAEIDKATVAGAKNLAGLRSETAVTTSLAVAQGGLTASEKQLLDAKIRKSAVTKAYTDSVRAEIAGQTQQIALSNAHVEAYRREQAAIEKRNASLAAGVAEMARVAKARQAMEMRLQPILSTGSVGLPTKATSAFAIEAEAIKKVVPLQEAHVRAYQAETAAAKALRLEQERLGASIVALQKRQNASLGLSAAPKDLFASYASDPKVAAVAPVTPIAYKVSGIESVDKMRASLAALKVEEAALHEGLRTGAITHAEYARGMDGVSKATNLAVAGNTRARGVFRQTASAIASATFEITGAVFGLTAAFGILTTPAAFGFKLLKTMEDTRLGMAAILISMGQINGEAIKLPKALELAEGMTARLQQNAMKYGVDMIALADTTKAVLASGLGGGLALKEVEEIALLGSIAVKTIGLDAKQSVQEIRDLVAGGIQAGSSTLAVALGIGNKEVKAWREAGTLFVNLKTAMVGFQDTAILKQDTLNGAWTIFVQKVQLLLANSSVFDTIKAKLIEISNAMGSVNTETGKFEFAPELVASVTSYWTAFKAGLATLSSVAAAIRALSPLIQGLAAVMNVAAFGVQITFGTLSAGWARQKEIFKGNFAAADKIWADWKLQAADIRKTARETQKAIFGMNAAISEPPKGPSITSLGLQSTSLSALGNTKLKGIYDPDNVTGKPQSAGGGGGDGGGGSKAVDPQVAFMAGLRKEAETLGLAEEAMKRYEASKIKLSASNKRLADTYISQIAAFKLQQEAAKANNEEAQKAIDADNERAKAANDKIAETEKAIAQIKFETSLLGLNEEARYRAIAAHELETNTYTAGNQALVERVALLKKETEQQSRITALLANTQTAKTQDFMANVGAADTAFFRGDIGAGQYDEIIKNITDATKDAKDKLGELDTFASRAAKNIQNSMADFLFNPFDKGLKGMAQGFGTMLQKMIAEAVAADLARKLFGGLTDNGKTSGSGLLGGALDWIGNILFSAQGNAFNGGHVQAFASGGIMGPTGGMLDRPTLFPMANGGLGIGGEAGVEAVMPLKRGSDGKLGVAAGGNSGPSHNITVIVRGGQSAPNVRRAAGQGAREALAALNGAKRYG